MFLIFAGLDYRDVKGWKSYKTSAPTFEAAQALHTYKDEGWSCTNGHYISGEYVDWYQIVDASTRQIVEAHYR